ncbi:unnamed protein product [Pocillopora meandrina]|uniref:Uncharacterized protein n=1 Tax=Pocillopora meandrina TaxID=46732 RepID=A0AAU9WYD8_9CNID|nr:unnamed protein product [Pocillopora meandrina]
MKTKEECPTSPGQDAEVSGPSINANETFSEEIIKEIISGKFMAELTSARKTETSDGPEEERPTSPGQVAKVSGPFINRNETYPKDVKKEMLADATGQCIVQLTSAKKKTETSDEPEDECPTSPGQDATVSAPFINRNEKNETCSKDIKKEMLADATGKFIGELTTAKFGGKYQIFLGFVMKYIRKFFPTSASKSRPEGMKK